MFPCFGKSKLLSLFPAILCDKYKDLLEKMLFSQFSFFTFLCYLKLQESVTEMKKENRGIFLSL